MKPKLQDTTHLLFHKASYLLYRNRLVLTVATSWAFFVADPAFAAFDLVQGITTLVTSVLTAFGFLVICIAGWKGWEATLDHRSVVSSLIGLVFGISLTFGGAWYLTQLGANGGAVAAPDI